MSERLRSKGRGRSSLPSGDAQSLSMRRRGLRDPHIFRGIETIDVLQGDRHATVSSESFTMPDHEVPVEDVEWTGILPRPRLPIPAAALAVVAELWTGTDRDPRTELWTRTDRDPRSGPPGRSDRPSCGHAPTRCVRPLRFRTRTDSVAPTLSPNPDPTIAVSAPFSTHRRLPNRSDRPYRPLFAFLT